MARPLGRDAAPARDAGLDRPGHALRDGLERILRGRTGALIVLGHDKIVESISTGGFTLDVPFTATGLRELAKMDGAIIVDKDITRIHRAAVHLMPDHTIPSEETGTRHRTADRVAKQTGYPVISVSQSMQIIAAYVGETRHVLEDSGQILSRANQALATLERYKLRLDEVSARCPPWRSRTSSPCATSPWSPSASRWSSGSPARSRTTCSSSAPTVGCSPCSSRSSSPASTPSASWSCATTCPPAGAVRAPTRCCTALEALSPTELVDPAAVARALGLGAAEHLDGAVAPRGYRLLAKVPRLPSSGGRPAGRPLRHPAEAALRRHRRPPGRRGRRRAARPQRPRGPLPPRGVERSLERYI